MIKQHSQHQTYDACHAYTDKQIRETDVAYLQKRAVLPVYLQDCLAMKQQNNQQKNRKQGGKGNMEN
ncbi:hypothetical protein HNQ54_001221 [Anaerocolumna cellulosilytica]|nr:hypothetical protein [Anaerocolumna cellulosilytica]